MNPQVTYRPILKQTYYIRGKSTHSAPETPLRPYLPARGIIDWVGTGHLDNGPLVIYTSKEVLVSNGRRACILLGWAN